MYLKKSLGVVLGDFPRQLGDMFTKKHLVTLNLLD
jgi:hypothetical protein